MLSIIKPTLMFMLCPHVHYSSASYLPQGQHAVYICPDIIFQIFLPTFRLIMSYHMTAMSCASSLFKINQKEKQNKRNAKSNKIDKRKEKLSMSKVFYNSELSSNSAL